ncbi:MAG: hypothetical protein AAGB31_07085, partial [Bdellovibrio sp.]
GNPEQRQFGRWYFHQIKTKTGFAFRGGSYKGVDLTLGDGKNSISVLIRSIECVKTGERVEGPSLVVDRILTEQKISSLRNLNKGFSLQVLRDSSCPRRPIYTGPRVGLAPSRVNEDPTLSYLFYPARFVTEAYRVRKGRVLLFLHQVLLQGFDQALKCMSMTPRQGMKYLEAFQRGQGKKRNQCQYTNSPLPLCELFGCYVGSIERDGSNLLLGKPE